MKSLEEYLEIDDLTKAGWNTEFSEVTERLQYQLSSLSQISDTGITNLIPQIEAEIELLTKRVAGAVVRLRKEVAEQRAESIEFLDVAVKLCRTRNISCNCRVLYKSRLSLSKSKKIIKSLGI